jgi:hypothetical protein
LKAAHGPIDDDPRLLTPTEVKMFQVFSETTRRKWPLPVPISSSAVSSKSGPKVPHRRCGRVIEASVSAGFDDH